jgi:hypothetical protein
MKSWLWEGMLAAAIVLPALSSVARADDFGCSDATLKGEYALKGAANCYTLGGKGEGRIVQPSGHLCAYGLGFRSMESG